MFAKSALLLSTFRFSSINYSLVCGLPIHTRSLANAEGPREHTVSWNRLKCCTNLRRIAFEKACNLWITFKVIQGHCRFCHLIGHIRFPISLSSLSCTVFEILTLLPKKLRGHVTLTTPTLGTVCRHKTNTSRANPCTKFNNSIFSHRREIYGV